MSVMCPCVIRYTVKQTNEVRRGNVSLYLAVQYVSLDVGFGLQSVLGLIGLLQLIPC